MTISQNWFAKFAGRVAANALIGGLLTALVGALCGGATSALLCYLLSLRGAPAAWDDGMTELIALQFIIGACLGAWSGIAGAFIFGATAATSGPGRLLAPLALVKRVALGQLLGALAALSSYLTFAWALAQFNAWPFLGTVEDNLELAIWGVPVTMIFGAIAGALWKREARQ